MQRSLVGEQGGDTGTAFDLLIESVESIVGSQLPPMSGTEAEDGEGFWDVLLEPAGSPGAVLW